MRDGAARLPLRTGVRRAGARGVRARPRRRVPRRRHPLHPRRRGRPGLAGRAAAHRRVRRRHGPALASIRPAPGARPRPTTCSPELRRRPLARRREPPRRAARRRRTSRRRSRSSSSRRRPARSRSPGATPRAQCYELLAVADVDWSEVDVFFGDERWVPVGDPDSNEGMARVRVPRPGPARARPLDAPRGRHHRGSRRRRTTELLRDARPHRPRPPRPRPRRAHRVAVPRLARARRARAAGRRRPATTFTRTRVSRSPSRRSRQCRSSCSPSRARTSATRSHRVKAGDDLPAARVPAGRVIWLVDEAANGCRRRTYGEGVHGPEPPAVGQAERHLGSPHARAESGGAGHCDRPWPTFAGEPRRACDQRGRAPRPRVTATASPSRPRCSSRSRCCAATAAGTARSPSRRPGSTSPYLELDEVLAIARRGAELRAATRRCSRWARRPRTRYPAAREWLDAHGYALDRRLPRRRVPGGARRDRAAPPRQRRGARRKPSSSASGR